MIRNCRHFVCDIPGCKSSHDVNISECPGTVPPGWASVSLRKQGLHETDVALACGSCIVQIMQNARQVT